MTAANTTPLTWNTYFSAVAAMMVVQTTTTAGVVVGVDADTNTVMPQACQYAELRIQRDLDLLPARTSQAYVLTAGNDQLVLSPNDFLTVETLSVDPGTGYAPLLPVSVEFIQNAYSPSATTGTPAYFAMYGGDNTTGGLTSNLILLGPPPANAYNAIVTGMQRLPSLYFNANTASAASATTFISTYYPDLLIQASMIFVAQFQRNFSAVSNDPQMPGIYEQQYQTLMAAARAENSRAKFESAGWSSRSAPVNASPGR